MPKRAVALTDRQIRALANRPELGFHPVGGAGAEGLALQVKSERAASWVLRVTVGARRRDIGLGGYPLVSLAEAREKALATRRQIREGVDPIQEKRAKRSAMMAENIASMRFKQVAQKFIEKKRREYRGKNISQRMVKLENQLSVYVYPIIGNLLPDDIRLPHIQKILDPIWESKVETANRVRLIVENVLDLAEVLGLREGKNPARWKGNLDHIYNKPSDVVVVKNHTALPVADLPVFIAKLSEKSTMSSRVLEFQILTAARPGESRSTRWDQIDLEAETWTIPADEMKSRKEHVVPLCGRLVELLKSLPQDGELVFPNSNGDQLSDVAVSKLAKKLAPGITCHGFRSTFKDWARIHAPHYRDEVSELQLAHVSSDATRAAYARDALLEERRRMMNEYEKFCGYQCEVSFLVPHKSEAADG